MFYDAVYHMRVLPAHLLRPVPRDQWRTAPFGRQPVGDGPYRFVRWQPGQSIELVADSTFFLGRPGIRRLIWRFTPNLQVAVQQVIADQADVREQLVTPDNVKFARAAQQLSVYAYRGNVYTYLDFNFRASDDTTKPHPLFGDRELRRVWESPRPEPLLHPLRSEVRRHRTIPAVIADVHRTLSESMDTSRFVTAVYGILDPALGTFTYINCGHNPPLLRRGSGAQEFLRTGRRAVGMLGSQPTPACVVTLARGDTLVFYTDGVIEVSDAGDTEFGTARDTGMSGCASASASKSAPFSANSGKGSSGCS
jgi:hypothetical protein